MRARSPRADFARWFSKTDAPLGGDRRQSDFEIDCCAGKHSTRETGAQRQVCRTLAGSEEVEEKYRAVQAHILTGQAKVNTFEIKADYHHTNIGDEH